MANRYNKTTLMHVAENLNCTCDIRVGKFEIIIFLVECCTIHYNDITKNTTFPKDKQQQIIKTLF